MYMYYYYMYMYYFSSIFPLYTIDVSSGVCNTNDHRLVNGSSNYEGRVEVCVNGEWSSVCGTQFWGDTEAAVACKATYGETGNESLVQ